MNLTSREFRIAVYYPVYGKGFGNHIENKILEYNIEYEKSILSICSIKKPLHSVGQRWNNQIHKMNFEFEINGTTYSNLTFIPVRNDENEIELELADYENASPLDCVSKLSPEIYDDILTVLPYNKTTERYENLTNDLYDNIMQKFAEQYHFAYIDTVYNWLQEDKDTYILLYKGEKDEGLENIFKELKYAPLEDVVDAHLQIRSIDADNPTDWKTLDTQRFHWDDDNTSEQKIIDFFMGKGFFLPEQLSKEVVYKPLSLSDYRE